MTSCDGGRVEGCNKCNISVTRCDGGRVEGCNKCNVSVTSCDGGRVEGCNKPQTAVTSSNITLVHYKVSGLIALTPCQLVKN